MTKPKRKPDEKLKPLTEQELAGIRKGVVAGKDFGYWTVERLLATIDALTELAADRNKDIDGLMALLAKARGERDALREHIQGLHREFAAMTDLASERAATIATLAAERDALRAEVEKMRARYQWAVNELLACDYGDNATPDDAKQIGWIVYGWRYGRPYEAWPHNEKPRIYGPTIDAAIDTALKEKPHGE